VFLLRGWSEEALEAQLVENPLRRSLMSHTLRRMHDKHLGFIEPGEFPTFWRDAKLPTPQQQADSLILWIGDNQKTVFSAALIDRPAIAAWVGLPISLPDDSTGWNWLHSELRAQDFYEATDVSNITLSLRLKMNGWDRYEALKKKRIESRTAFMAMQYGDKFLDSAVEHCFKPAVRRTGFELRVLTENLRAGLIDDQLRAAILASRFVIADLTHENRGAYWEAGFGEGLGLDVIYTCEKGAWEREGTHTHFDTNHLNTIIWDSENLKEAENRLAATIRATLRAEAKQSDEETS
jgi:hypothetical protein